ncbi:MAG: phage Gp37/Gp68 family protein [Reyranella sp.]|nr:phage Gp37/Gp68 family protein [Reyranella sp.]
MAENSKIEWCRHTFNPWVGCTRLSPACQHCYAEGWARRTGQSHLWEGERRRTSVANWQQPLKWNRAAAAAGERHRVFCASLADVFDNQVPEIWRSDLFALIEATPNLDWMLLTKRPQNIAKMIWPKWDAGLPPNVWLGTTVEDRLRMANIEHLRRVPAIVRFLSIEPLLEDLGKIDLTGIQLVIVGGESEPNARPMQAEWVQNIRDQCAEAGVAFFFKQHGDWIDVGQLRHLEGWTGGPGFGRFDHCHYDQDLECLRVGKKAAGRLLDGVEHNGMPEVRHVG